MKKEAESVTAASMAKVKEAGAGTESMQKEMQKLKETHAAELKQQQEQSQKQYDNAKEEMSAAHSAALAAQAERLKQETVAEVERCLLEAENEAQRRLEAQADKLKAEASKRASVFQGKTQQYMAIIKQLRASNQVKQQKDAAKHQEADQLGGAIAKSGISDSHFFFHEVIEGANEAVTPDMYFTLGQVTEFDFGQTVGQAFKNQDLSQLSNLASNLFESDKAVVFIDNHDTQRGNAPLTYKDKQPYILATVFMLGHPYGHPKVMSSYEFSTHDQGPPSSPVHSGSNLNCGQGQWVCEHRNPLIAPMMGFRKATGTDAVGNFVTGQSNAAAAFSRGKSGFLAVNLANNDWSSTFNSDLVRALCFVCARDSRPTMVVIVSDYVCLGVGCWIIQRYILRKQSNSKR